LLFAPEKVQPVVLLMAFCCNQCYLAASASKISIHARFANALLRWHWRFIGPEHVL
jgi:hypothetical protein